MEGSEIKQLAEAFAALPEPGSERNQDHPLVSIEIRVTCWENLCANGCRSLDDAGRLPLAFREALVIIRTYEQYGTSQAPAQGKKRGSDPDAGHSPHSPGGSQPGQARRAGCGVAGVQAVMRTLHGLFLHQKRTR